MQQAFRFTSGESAAARANLVIEAGAGTGKTSAIVGEVLKLLLENEDLAPERIVLMTFTEKAAGEIADRIHHALAELELHFDDERVFWPAGSPKPLFEAPPEKKDQYRRACAKQVERIESIRSQTIHSFCQSLLRAYPIEAGLDPQFRIIEGFERSLLYGQLYDAWLDEETRTRPTEQTLREWEFLMAHVGYLFQIRDLVFSLLARRDLLEEEYDFGNPGEIEHDLAGALTTIRRSDISRVSDRAARTVFRYIQSVEPPPPGSLDAWIDYFAPIATAIEEANLPSEADLKEALVVLRTERTKGSSIHERLLRHRSALAVHALTRRFIDFLDREKRALGVVDFDDLLLRTVALLDNRDVLERVRRQFDYIFVDEFQDTDRTQARIIDRLGRDRTGAWVAGKLVIVGDPKQSIYGFRRADPETYRLMTASMVNAGAETRVLRHQYRSDPPLLETINVMFEAVFRNGGAADPNVFRPPYHRLLPAKEPDRDLDARVTFLHAEAGHSGEAEAVAAWIQKHRDGGDRDLQRIAVLFRRLTRIDDYLDTFDRHGIDYVLPPTKAFLERRSPVDLLAVLRAIGCSFDLGAAISASRTPYFALTDQEIADGVIAEQDGATIPAAWASFRAALQSYREASRHLTVTGTIDLLVRTAGIEEVYTTTRNGHRSKRHLEHMRALAFQYDQKIGGSVRQFVEEIERRRADPDEMEPSLADDDSNAVRILSVHAAKGLEFETVILPDLAFKTKGGSEGLELFTVEEPRSLVMSGRAQSLSAHYRFAGSLRLKKIEGEREEAEARRLFYVAVTRARTDVVFVCNTDSFRNTGFLSYLSETFGFDKQNFTRLWNGEGREVREMIGIPVAFEKLQRERDEAAVSSRRGDEGRCPPLEIAEPEVPAQFDAATAGRMRARSRNRAAGVLLHRFLEQWDGAADAEALLQHLAHEAAATGGAVTAVRERIATLRSSETLRRILAAETIAREMSIRFLENGRPVERRIDRLVREGEAEIVIDYKSGTPDQTRLPADREQVQRYCAAVEAIAGRPCRGLLWYIDVENDVAVRVE
jgi:ATP-dependent helicase/nuclease subunit A